MKICNTCGNDIPQSKSVCPYCSSQQSRGKIKSQTLITCNLEAGMPLVEEAMSKLDKEISKRSREGVKVLKIIHGYGSSGTGGRIREALFKRLNSKKRTKVIKHFYNCDAFPNSIDEFQTLIRLVPELKDKFKHDQRNKGVSFIVL